jgi:hypothetical protein
MKTHRRLGQSNVRCSGINGREAILTVETFGVSEDAKWQVRNADFSGELSLFEVLRASSSWENLKRHCWVSSTY